MIFPDSPKWLPAVERGIQIAVSRREKGLDISFGALYADFINSCQDVPIKWLDMFTYAVRDTIVDNCT